MTCHLLMLLSRPWTVGKLPLIASSSLPSLFLGEGGELYHVFHVRACGICTLICHLNHSLCSFRNECVSPLATASPSGSPEGPWEASPLPVCSGSFPASLILRRKLGRVQRPGLHFPSWLSYRRCSAGFWLWVSLHWNPRAPWLLLSSKLREQLLCPYWFAFKFQ